MSETESALPQKAERAAQIDASLTTAKIGRLFLWDLFNPQAWWVELNSTHPLTGKRVRALSNYAEQLGLAMEFDMSHVVAEGKRLSAWKPMQKVGSTVVLRLGWIWNFYLLRIETRFPVILLLGTVMVNHLFRCKYITICY